VGRNYHRITIVICAALESRTNWTDLAPAHHFCGSAWRVKSPLAALAADALLTHPARSRMTGHYRSEAVKNRVNIDGLCQADR